MKKVFTLFALLTVLVAGKAMAQLPNCSNNNGLESKIQSIVNQGFTETNRELYQVAYLVAPEPPYLTATLEVTFVGPYCGPACTPAIRVERYDAVVVNNNGGCVWQLGGN
jgi:hypothetical protein